MPRDTFFNLPQEKKNKILNAAKEEFTYNELMKSRVSNIIKVADIPRGSFYQYFDDLEDLYLYVIEEMFDSIYEEGAKTALKTDNIFEFSYLTFDYDYKAFINDKRHRFMMNVLKSLSDYEEYANHFNEKTTNYIMSILNQMDLTNIRYTKQDELVKMYKFIQDTKRIVIRKSMIAGATPEEAKEEFKWYLDMLKRGIIKE